MALNVQIVNRMGVEASIQYHKSGVLVSALTQFNFGLCTASVLGICCRN
jgi:hypothetical protein